MKTRFRPFLIILILSWSCVLVLAPTASSQDLLAEFKIDGVFGSIGAHVAVLDDFTGDGLKEMLVEGANGVFVVSGATGEKTKHIPIPLGPDSLHTLIGLGDVDHDQIPDFAVSDWYTIRVFSTASGSVLWSVAGSAGGSIGIAWPRWAT